MAASAGGVLTATASVESPTGRRLGELLVEERIISDEQLERLLRLQAAARSHVPLGQLAVLQKHLTRKQLVALLHRHRKRLPLGEILVKSRCITSAQLGEALAHQARARVRIGQALIRLGHVSEMTMRDALCTQLHVNFFDLDPISIDRSLARLISRRFAMRHLVIPLARSDNVLVVAMDDPSQTAFIESLQHTLGLPVETVTTTSDKLAAAMRRLYGPSAPPAIDVFRRRNVLIGPVRDPVVIELASRALPGVSFLSGTWQ